MAVGRPLAKVMRNLLQNFKLFKGPRHADTGREPGAELREQSRARRSVLVLYSGLMFWGLLAAWTLLNLLAQRFPPKFNIDASDDQIYSLSAASEAILAELRQPVTIYALFSPGKRPTRPLDVYRYLELYQSKSSYVQVQEVDPALQPELIRPFITGIDKRGRGANKAPQRNSLIVFTRGDKPRFRVIHYDELFHVMERFGPRNAGIQVEQQISSAITYVNGVRVARLGILSGHREQSLATIQPNFEQFNIEAEPLNLLQSRRAALQQIDVLLVYKPQLDLSDAEYEALHNYLEEGKALWLVLDFQAERLQKFYELAADYGIEILEGLVMERDPKRIQAASGYTTFVTPIDQLPRPGEKEDFHPIVRPLQENKVSDLLWSQSMALKESLPHSRRIRFYSLVESSPSSLLRTSRDPSSGRQLQRDLTGPLTLLGLSVWQDERGHRAGAAVLLSFDMPGLRSVFSTPSNLQLFYSAISWLGQAQGAADGVPSQLLFPSRSLLMLPLRLSQAQAVWWAVIFVLLIPLAIFLAGLLFLRHRKRL